MKTSKEFKATRINEFTTSIFPRLGKLRIFPRELNKRFVCLQNRNSCLCQTMELCTLYFADNYNNVINTYRFRLIANNLCQGISFLPTLEGYIFAQKFLNRAKFANE